MTNPGFGKIKVGAVFFISAFIKSWGSLVYLKDQQKSMRKD